jgi:hypothetical protein
VVVGIRTIAIITIMTHAIRAMTIIIMTGIDWKKQRKSIIMRSMSLEVQTAVVAVTRVKKGRRTVALF